MALNKERNSLGRGLASLLPENPNDEKKEGFAYIDIDKISPNPYQPRQSIPASSVLELSESIKEKGVILPLTVVPRENGKYTLAAGERRLNAATLAGFKQVPVIIKILSDVDLAEVAIIENIHRKDLNAIEEGFAYLRLNREFDLPTEEIARKISKSKTYVESKIKLTELPRIIQNAIAVGEISENHGKLLLSLDDEQAMIASLKIIVRNHLSTEKTEELIRQIKTESKIIRRKPNPSLDWYEKYNYVKDDLKDALGGYEVKLKRNQKNGGSLMINFNSDEELIDIYKRIRAEKDTAK